MEQQNKVYKINSRHFFVFFVKIIFLFHKPIIFSYINDTGIIITDIKKICVHVIKAEEASNPIEPFLDNQSDMNYRINI